MKRDRTRARARTQTENKRKLDTLSFAARFAPADYNLHIVLPGAIELHVNCPTFAILIVSERGSVRQQQQQQQIPRECHLSL